MSIESDTLNEFLGKFRYLPVTLTIVPSLKATSIVRNKPRFIAVIHPHGTMVDAEIAEALEEANDRINDPGHRWFPIGEGSTVNDAVVDLVRALDYETVTPLLRTQGVYGVMTVLYRQQHFPRYFVIPGVEELNSTTIMKGVRFDESDLNIEQPPAVYEAFGLDLNRP